MNAPFHIVVCAGLVPDPLQTLEPVVGPSGPELKNDRMLPAVLDPWAAHALYEAAHLAALATDSRVWLVSLGPKPRLQQLMMTVAQRVAFELVALDGPAGGFTEPFAVAGALADAIGAIAGLDRSRLLLFGGCASASRDAGVTLALVGERLGIPDQFLAVDGLAVTEHGLRIRERVEGGRYLASLCAGPPVVVGWATGTLPQPPNNPRVGMANMRTLMPALQRARPVTLPVAGVSFVSVQRPQQRRETRIVQNASSEEMARELVEWITG